MAKTALAREQLQSFVDRLSRPDPDRRDGLEIYREAMAAGFDRDALHGTVRFAKMDRADAKEAWATLDLYMSFTVLA